MAKLGIKLPKIDTKAPIDPTRESVTSSAPPEQSIYSNPVTMMNTTRTPASNQVGGLPNGQLSNPNLP